MLSGHTPFVGRERQLAELTAALDAAEFGEHVLALVAGEPGIGKTRLVNEATSRDAAVARPRLAGHPVGR